MKTMSTILHEARVCYLDRNARIAELREIAEGIDGTATADRLVEIADRMQAALDADMKGDL